MVDSITKVNYFHTLSGLFYLTYGFIYIFFYPPYYRDYKLSYRFPVSALANINADDFMLIGPGECCITLAIMTYFMDIFVDHSLNYTFSNNGIKKIVQSYFLIQVCVWIILSVTSMYHLFSRFNIPAIFQCFFSLLILIFAIFVDIR